MNEQIINPINNIYETGKCLVENLFDSYNNTMTEYIKENADKIRSGSLGIFYKGFNDLKIQQKLLFEKKMAALYKDDVGAREYINDIMDIKDDTKENISLVKSQATILLIEKKYSSNFQNLIKEIANSSVEDGLKK